MQEEKTDSKIWWLYVNLTSIKLGCFTKCLPCEWGDACRFSWWFQITPWMTNIKQWLPWKWTSIWHRLSQNSFMHLWMQVIKYSNDHLTATYKHIKSIKSTCGIRLSRPLMANWSWANICCGVSLGRVMRTLFARNACTAGSYIWVCAQNMPSPFLLSLD